MTVAKAIARAWTDSEFKQRLLDNPPATLAETGVDVPANINFKVVENTADLQYIVLSAIPRDSKGLSAEDLQEVAGGMGNCWSTCDTY